MESTHYLIFAILCMAVTTFATRALPFVLLKNYAQHPVLLHLGRYLPPAVMTLLVLYSLKNISLTMLPYGLPELCAIVIVVLMHIWRRNALLSIASGTAFFMFVQQTTWLHNLLV